MARSKFQTFQRASTLSRRFIGKRVPPSRRSKLKKAPPPKLTSRWKRNSFPMAVAGLPQAFVSRRQEAPIAQAVNQTHLHPPVTNSGLHRFAIVTAFATLLLLGIGGLVTSHGVGMAVPDWPNTYGYNMFFFPISRWVGGIFYEHTHRLVASVVGLLTSILALWLYGKHARPFLRWTGLVLSCAGPGIFFVAPRHWADGLVLCIVGLGAFTAGFFWPRCEPSPRWLRSLGLIAFVAVLLQGVLGGLRVVLFKDEIGIFHATLAQLFFVLICALSL